MPFEVYQRQRVAPASDPYVTIHRRGVISLNSVAWAGLGQPDCVELLYDRETNEMGIRGVEPEAAQAYRLRLEGAGRTSRVLSGRGFFQYYGIPLEHARRFIPLARDGMLVVNLSDEHATVVSTPGPPKKVQHKRFPKPPQDS